MACILQKKSGSQCYAEVITSWKCKSRRQHKRNHRQDDQSLRGNSCSWCQDQKKNWHFISFDLMSNCRVVVNTKKIDVVNSAKGKNKNCFDKSNQESSSNFRSKSFYTPEYLYFFLASRRLCYTRNL